MPAADVAQAHAAQRQALAVSAAAVAARAWTRVDPAAISTTWQRQLTAVAGAVSGAQLASAQTADPYVQAALLADGAPASAQYAVAAGAFAGVAADGRGLVTLLYEPAITALAGVQGGQPPGNALRAGLRQLNMLVRTEVADAGRTADQVAATTHGVAGYVRLTVGHSCSRCIILAGRWYPYSAGFQRHPRCDCVMIPAAEGDDPPQSPQGLYDTMTPEQRQAAGWSKAEQQAIADGADIAAVTNIHRGGLYVAGGRQFTHEAAGRRPRITPRQIYIEAGNDRDEAIRLLKLHGYIR